MRTSGARLIPLVALVVVPCRAGAQDSPRLQDPRLAAERLQNNYPEDLQHLGVGGKVILALRILPEGKVDSVVVVRSSNIPALDEAARLTALGLRFTTSSAAQWVDFPLTFQPGDGPVREYTQLPQLLNRDALRDSVRARLAGKVREPGILSVVQVVVTIDSLGTVTDARAREASCQREFVDATQRSARTARFHAANTPDAAPRQTILTFVLTANTAVLRLPGETRDTAMEGQPPRPDEGPRYTRYTTPPELRNRNELASALLTLYPPKLRDAGVGGTVPLWILIDEQGNVQRRMIKTSSGECAFDQAAFGVAGIMRFQPATLDEKPVSVWVDVPIVFKSLGIPNIR